MFTVFYALFAIIVAAPSLGLILAYFEDRKDASAAAVRMDLGSINVNALCDRALARVQ